MWDMLQRQLAVDGLSSAEVTALGKLATDWGLVDSGTQTAWQKMQDYITSLGGAEIDAYKLEAAIDSIPRELDVTITGNIEEILNDVMDWWKNNPEVPEGHQFGGSIYAGEPAIVGEAGRELIWPTHDAEVIDNSTTEYLLGNIDMLADAIKPLVTSGLPMGLGGASPVNNYYMTVNYPTNAPVQNLSAEVRQMQLLSGAL